MRMEQIADDPIIAWMERTGYPPWFGENTDDNDETEGEQICTNR